MKNFLIGLAAAAAAVVFLHHAFASHPRSPVDAINAIVGDASFRETFGRDPSATTDEDLRIRTHLAYVLRELRSVPVPAERRAARERNLERLERYIALGVFPRNLAGTVHGRTPNFLDASGRICAVGYLVREDLGPAAVAAINSRWQFARVEEMESAELAAWQATSGLTRRELAMIQPAYCEDGGPGCGGGLVIDDVGIPAGDGDRAAAEGVVGMGNLAFAAMNGVHLGQGKRSTWLGLAGMTLGAPGFALAIDDEATMPAFDAIAGTLAFLSGTVHLTRPRPEATPSLGAASPPQVQLGPVVRGGERLLAVQVRF
jgi:hypothetical protein